MHYNVLLGADFETQSCRELVEIFAKLWSKTFELFSSNNEAVEKAHFKNSEQILFYAHLKK